jgi:hypothetical protein
LRNGGWLNDACPGLNAVCDCDNNARQRIARIEFKNPNERISAGQRFHLEACLNSVARPWVAFAYVVVDAGQESLDDPVQWWKRQSADVRWVGPCDGTVQQLAETIVGYVWPQTLTAA